MENLADFKALMARPKKVAIVMHFKPDADALGSALGLAGFLTKSNHLVTVVSPSDYPDFLNWMPGNEHVLAVVQGSPNSLKKAEQAFAEAEVIFCLDFNSPKRIEVLEDALRKSTAVKVMIDHHLEPEDFADFKFWSVQSASTAGLIYELIELLDATNRMDANIANCLYAGLMTDTGNFRHNNTHAREFEIAAALVRAGASPHDVAREIYDTNSLERLQLIGFALSQKLTVLPDFKTAYLTITHDELKQFNSRPGDTEGLVNYGLSIKGVRMSVLIYDRGDEIKMSFRSLGQFSVNELARQHFSGGGHRNAAGGKSPLSLEATLQKLLELLPTYKLKLNQD